MAVWLGIGASALPLWLLGRKLGRGRLARLGWLSRVEPRMKLAPLLLLAAFGAGGLRSAGAHLPPGPGDLAFYNNQGRGTLRGWVADFPDERDQVTLLRVAVDEVVPQG